MIFDAFGPNGLEGSEADVKRNFDDFDAALTDPVEDFRSEVQSGGRRRDRTAFLRIDSLIAITIGGGVVAIDVRRKRNVTEFLDCSEEIWYRSEANATLAEFAAGNDLGDQFIVITEEEALTDGNLSAGPNEAFPFIRILLELASE